MRRKLAITLLTTMMLFSLWQLTTNVSAQAELTLAKILTGLQTKGNTPETSTLAARNIYITKRVQTYGVNFELTPDRESDLRAAGATSALIAAIRANGPAKPTPTPYRTTPTPYNNNGSRPSASFKDIWVDYDITEGGKKGMRIHVKFTTYGMKGLDSYLAIYFLDARGNSLKDKGGDSAYASSLDTVAVYRDLKPGYDPAEYADYAVFMPYAELDLPDGDHNLTMDVKLIYKAGGAIQDLTKKDFNYKQGNVQENTNTRPTGNVSAKLNQIWVDYDINEGGQRGMRIHVNFEVTGLKGIDSKLTVRVQRDNGNFLTSSSSYSNDEGQLAAFFEMKPGYPTTVYKDADIFLPYNEIRINRGKWNLKLDVDLSYDDGELIQHLGFHEFEFTQP